MNRMFQLLYKKALSTKLLMNECAIENKFEVFLVNDSKHLRVISIWMASHSTLIACDYMQKCAVKKA